MFSNKQWVKVPFCDGAKARTVSETDVGGKRLISRVRMRRAGRQLRLRVVTRRKARLAVVAQRGKLTRRVRPAKARKVHVIVVRRLPARGRIRVTLTARAGKVRHSVTRVTPRA